VLQSCIRRGWSDPPVRHLASKVGRSRRQIHRGLAILETAGRLRRIRRRISRTRNLTTVYVLIGVCDARVTEKQKRKDLKTKAPRAARAISSTRQRWYENRIACLETRLAYHERGQLIAQARQWRNKREAESAHMAVMAMVGVYRGESRMPPDEIERLAQKHERPPEGGQCGRA
jgi:hypothetical protein